MAPTLRRTLANFLQRNFGDASVPPADCRLPPVTLTLDLTLLEFFNYTTSTEAGSEMDGMGNCVRK